MLVDFIFNLLSSVSEENRTIWDRRAHFSSLKSREKFAVNTRSLWNFQFILNITGHSEIRILVDSLRDEAHHVFLSENMWERSRNSRSSLNSREGKLSTVVTRSDTKDTFQLIYKNKNKMRIIFDLKLNLNLVVCDSLLDLADIWIHVPNIVCISEDKCLVDIKSASDDILGILNCEILIFLFCFSK